MRNLRTALILCACCLGLTTTRFASADFVGLVAENKTDDDTVKQCTGLTVCNVSIQFSDDGVAPDRLLSVAFSDVQVLGAPGALFNQHMFGGDTPYQCIFLDAFPDLVCDSYVAIGEKCAGLGDTVTDPDFDDFAFNNTGGISGGWLNFDPFNGLGDAFGPINPEGKILILQVAVVEGLTVEGILDVFWQNIGNPLVFQEFELAVFCGEGGGCQNDGECDDGNLCTINTCEGGVCMSEPLDCNDDNECTDDDCDPGSGCTNENNNADCEDGNMCTEGDQCSGGSCQPGGKKNCDDNDECTTDGCDMDSGCTHEDVECNDNNDCTTDDCDAVDGCSNTPDCAMDTDCDDGLLCTTDTCTPDGCCENPAVECPKGQVCNPDNGDCEELPCENDSDCDDGNACTVDTCDAGVCTTEPLDCNDDNECTDDDCDPGSGCTHENNNAECQDGNACTDPDQCSGGSCQPGGKIDCDDNDECTTDGCDPASGCTYEDVDCNDDNDCTADDCDSVDGCSNTPDCSMDTDCDDGLLCTTDTCTAQGCCENTAVECPPGEVCNPDNGNCEELPCENDSDCDDGNACTIDTCDGGVCGTEPVDCNDNNECTVDGCDPASGCTHDEIECPLGQACNPDNGDCEEITDVELHLDIKPKECPNKLMSNTNQTIWAALLGTDDFDITQVRTMGIELRRADGVGQALAPKNLKFKDEGTPFEGELCDCHAVGKDQTTDLRMKFKADAMVEAFELDGLPSGSVVELIVTGTLMDATPFFGHDCILIMR